MGMIIKRLLLYVIIALVAFACAKFEEPATNRVMVDAPDTLYAEVSEDTRTYIESDKYIRWSAGDEISYFKTTYNLQYRFKGSTGDGSGAFDLVTTSAGVGSALSNSYAIYPYVQSTTINTNGAISFELPATQLYAENSFGSGANTMVAVAENSDDNILYFKNACGYLKLRLYGDASAKSIAIKGNKGEKLAGLATITSTYGGTPSVAMNSKATTVITLDCGEGVKLSTDVNNPTTFWIVVPPTTFEEGFTMSVTDVNGNVYEKVTNKSVAIKRNNIQPMAALKAEFNTEKPASNEIWYTTTDGKQLDLIEDRFGTTITSHKQRDDMWVITFDGNLSMLGVEGAWNGAFESMKTLKSVVLPDDITTIGDYAFYNCSALQSVILPVNLQTIGTQAFQATKLKEVTIPASVTNIKSKAFYSAPLTKVNVFATTPPNIDSEQVFTNRYVPVYVPEASIKLYEQHAVWGYFVINALPDESLGGDDSEGGNGDNPGGGDNDESGDQGGDDNGGNDGDDPDGDDPVVKPTTGNEIRYTTTDGNPLTLRTQYFNASVASHEKVGNEWVVTFNGALTTIGAEGSSIGAFEFCNTLTSITIPDSVTKMHTYTFYECTNLQSVELSDNITFIGAQAFYCCLSLAEVTIPASVTLIDGAAFYDCSSLSSVTCLATTPPALGDDKVFPAGMTIRVPDSAIGAYLKHTGWKRYNIVTISGESSDDALMYAPNDPNYISSDYAADGKYVALQSASEGNGIDIVLMGDGYSDRQVASGRYEADMRKAMEVFFSKEPYTSFRHLFNVYMVTCVSKREGCSNDYDRDETALNCKIKSDGISIDADTWKVYAHAKEIFGEQAYEYNDGPRTDESTMIVIMNSDVYAGCCLPSSPKYNSNGKYGNGPSLSFFPLCGDDELFANLLIHEACGHGFAKLADEYFSSGNGTITPYYHSQMKDFEQWGWFKNVDATTGDALTSQTIKWKHFLNDSRYSGLVGIYEGAYTFAKNAYRPSENSIMRHVKDSDGSFNAPSREAIYLRIHKLAYGNSWQYDYEKFVEWDAKNRNN